MKRTYQILSLGFSFLIAILFLTGCAKDEGISPGGTIEERAPGTATGKPLHSFVIGLSENNELVKLSVGPPATELQILPLRGLDTNETMLAIDFHPTTKVLYGVSSANKIYHINTNYGLAGSVSRTPFTPGIHGEAVGFDINPADGMIRLVTDADQNLRIDPRTAQVVAVDVNIAPSLNDISGIAYASSSGGSGTSNLSTLYDIDWLNGSLYRQNGNAGMLALVGSLGVDVLSEVGFDASSKGTAFATFLGASRTPGFGPGIGGNTDDLTIEAYRIWGINLTTGAATSYGSVRSLRGIAIP
jgi:hypothetical protein